MQKYLRLLIPNGTGYRVRTNDTWIMIPLLYQLS